MGVSEPTTAPAQGAQGVQPAAAGQGVEQQPTGDAKGDGFWGNFPNVPEEQRSLLEPHLKSVQAHVTKLEQQVAPYKQLAAAGYDPQRIGQLVGFERALQANPLETWITITQNLQNAGALHEDLDLEALMQVAQGQYVDDEGGEEEFEANGNGNPEYDQLRNEIQQLREEREQEKLSSQQQAREAQENRLLAEGQQKMKTELVAAGFPEESITDDLIISALITTRGDVEKAIQMHTTHRDALLKSTTTPGQKPPLEMPKGTPRSPAKPRSKGRDAFADANVGAEQFLKHQNAAAARG